MEVPIAVTKIDNTRIFELERELNEYKSRCFALQESPKIIEKEVYKIDGERIRDMENHMAMITNNFKNELNIWTEKASMLQREKLELENQIRMLRTEFERININNYQSNANTSDYERNLSWIKGENERY